MVSGTTVRTKGQGTWTVAAYFFSVWCGSFWSEALHWQCPRPPQTASVHQSYPQSGETSVYYQFCSSCAQKAYQSKFMFHKILRTWVVCSLTCTLYCVISVSHLNFFVCLFDFCLRLKPSHEKDKLKELRLDIVPEELLNPYQESVFNPSKLNILKVVSVFLWKCSLYFESRGRSLFCDVKISFIVTRRFDEK